MPRQSHWKEVIEGEARKRLPMFAEVEVAGSEMHAICRECGELLSFSLPGGPSQVTQWFEFVRNWTVNNHKYKLCKPKPLKLPEPPKPTVTRHITFED